MRLTTLCFAAIVAFFISSCGGKIEWDESKFERLNRYFISTPFDTLGFTDVKMLLLDYPEVPDSVVLSLIDSSSFENHFSGGNQVHGICRFSQTDRGTAYILTSNEDGIKLYLMVMDNINGIMAISHKIGQVDGQGRTFLSPIITDLNGDGVKDFRLRKITSFESEGAYPYLEETWIWHQDRFVLQE